ncbi:MAG TPA: MFS transporter [Micromonosporaceae bacterium]|jgi:MFS family permease
MTTGSEVLPAAQAATAPTVRRGTQRRTVAVLMAAQTVGGVGSAVGIAVGALLTARMGGTGISGLGQSALVVGSALLAVPTTRLMTGRGRRPGLVLAYLIGALGGVTVVAAAEWNNLALLFVGLFCFGGGSTAGLQARYAAVDLAAPARRGRQLSLVVWATAVGSVAGPNVAPLVNGWLGHLGVALYAGPFAVSAVAFTLAAVIVLTALRPDPLLTARALAAAAGPEDRPVEASVPARRPVGASGLRAAAREIAAAPGARLGLAAMAVGHLVMIGVMSLTPVHIGEYEHGDTLRVVGLVISVHIAGMYGLSPVAGWLTDRIGRRGVIVGGIALLVAACVVAGASGHGTAGLAVGLVLLGMGWSATMVSGSTLLAESVGLGNRASVQGLSDLVMGLGGASAAALAGLIVYWSSYAVLTAVAALATVPLLAAALRSVPSPAGGHA